MDERKWRSANELIEKLYECERRASLLATAFWHRRSKEGVSHPSEDILNEVKGELVKMRKLVADVARRECG